MRVPSRRIFYAAITTWFSDRCRCGADDGVREGRAEFVHSTGKPLLLKQSEVRHTLYWYLPKGSNAPLLCLDGSPFIVPSAPTWREFLSGVCSRLYRRQPLPEDVDMWRRHYDVEPAQLDFR
jgi:hypothetical protein